MPALLEGDDFHNPKLTGPRKSKEIPSGGVYSAYASTKIDASPKEVYDAILNVGDWKEWNRFVYKVTITKTLDPHARESGSHKRIQAGSCMVFYAKLNSGEDEKETRIREVVTHVGELKTSQTKKKDGQSGSPGVTRIRWRLDNAAITTPGFLLKSERVNEIEEQADGSTVYRTWQTFSGPIARYLRKRLEIPVRDRLQDMVEDLKNWVEKKHTEAAASAAATAMGGTSTDTPGRFDSTKTTPT